MSIENVKKFYDSISQDEALKQKFAELSQAYQGQPLDEVKALELAEEKILPLAKQLGYAFTMDDVKMFGEEMKQAYLNGEMDDNELMAVTGGGGSLYCVLLGFNERPLESQNFGACVFLGFNGAGGFCCLIGAGTKG